MQKKGTPLSSRTPVAGGASTLSSPSLNTGPLKEITLLTTNHNDYDLDYIPRAIYNNQVDELLLREEGMSGRIQKHSKKKSLNSRSASPVPTGSPRFNTNLLSQSSTPNISRNHSRFASANRDSKTPADSESNDQNDDNSSSSPLDPDLLATESRMVVLTELGINIITPAYTAIIPPLPKAHIANPQDTPIYTMGTHKALPPTFPRTIRAATWRNTLAVSTEQVIFEAKKNCAAMETKTMLLSKEYTLRYEKPRGQLQSVVIRRSGLSFRGRGVLEERARQGAVEGMGTRAPVETVFAKSLPNEVVTDQETSITGLSGGVGAGSRRESGRRSRGNSVAPVMTAVEFKSPLFSKFPVTEVAEPLSMDEETGAEAGFYSPSKAVAAPPAAYLNEEADIWAAPTHAFDENPFVQADLKQKHMDSTKNSHERISVKNKSENSNSPTESEEWLIQERRAMNQNWGRDSQASTSNAGSHELASASKASSPTASTDLVNIDSKADSGGNTTAGNSSTKMVDSFLKQFENKNSSSLKALTSLAPDGEHQESILYSFKKMVEGSIEVLSTSDESVNHSKSAENPSSIPVTKSNILAPASSPFSRIDGLDEPNWGDVIVPPSPITNENKSKSASSSKTSLKQKENDFAVKSLPASEQVLAKSDETQKKEESFSKSTEDKANSHSGSVDASRVSISINGKLEQAPIGILLIFLHFPP
ncbi:hypothetical protein BDR26DRAFT_232338 [Obelidium mucronatum]|nr:hypothetical protein BDR26DRAFT_232338 [Obelidium mucronatum]